MLNSFERFVAQRYLRAKRKEAAISLITVISVLGVAAGVMALIVALAINNGFSNTLQGNLLGATAHVMILAKQPEDGIADSAAIIAKLKRISHVRSAVPVLYGQVLLVGPKQSGAATVKGILTGGDVPETLKALPAGVLQRLNETTLGLPGIIVGARLAQTIGMVNGSVVKVISPQGELTPMGPSVSTFRFRVLGTFETGFADLDNQWAYVSLASAQKILSNEGVVNAIELKLDDVYKAPEVAAAADRMVGTALAATNWMEQNRSVLNALRMEKIVTVITIGLIQLVAAFNILIALIMLVMEKYRDIAILMSMGARREQIRNIFIWQGVLIGITGTIIGMVAGYALCFFAEHYRLIRLDEDVYPLSYVPFQPQAIDGVWIASAAILISFIATIYPARNATRITPVEALRYE